MHSTESGPNSNRLVDIIATLSVSTQFNRAQTPKLAAEASTKATAAIMRASARNILNTSSVREPIARSIPISFFLAVIEADIKLNMSNSANAASTIPIHMNAVLMLSTI